jgi:hypothetical protein
MGCVFQQNKSVPEFYTSKFPLHVRRAKILHDVFDFDTVGRVEIFWFGNQNIIFV